MASGECVGQRGAAAESPWAVMRFARVPCKVTTDASFSQFPVSGPAPLFPHIATQTTFDPCGQFAKLLLVIGVVEVLPSAVAMRLGLSVAPAFALGVPH